jgi:hypothetical protein
VTYFENLYQAYRLAWRGKRDRPAVADFEFNLEANLPCLQTLVNKQVSDQIDNCGQEGGRQCKVELPEFCLAGSLRILFFLRVFILGFMTKLEGWGGSEPRWYPHKK